MTSLNEERLKFLARVPKSVTTSEALAKWCWKECQRPNHTIGNVSSWTYFTAVQLGFKGHMTKWSNYVEDQNAVPKKATHKTTQPGVVEKRRPGIKIFLD
jgi:hypothetical protein